MTLWGIGRYRAREGMVTFAVSEADVVRDRATARKALASLGIARGARVLVVSCLSEAVQYWPLQAEIVAAGARLSCADAMRFDAFRTGMFLARLRYDAVIGVNAEVLDGLGELDRRPGEVFAGVPVIAARDDAGTRLREAGLQPRLWLPLGPTIGVECAPGRGAHVDGEEWAVESDGSEIRVSARRPRATVIERVATGIRGTIVTEPCACGRDDPRVLPA